MSLLYYAFFALIFHFICLSNTFAEVFTGEVLPSNQHMKIILYRNTRISMENDIIGYYKTRLGNNSSNYLTEYMKVRVYSNEKAEPIKAIVFSNTGFQYGYLDVVLPLEDEQNGGEYTLQLYVNALSSKEKELDKVPYIEFSTVRISDEYAGLTKDSEGQQIYELKEDNITNIPEAHLFYGSLNSNTIPIYTNYKTGTEILQCLTAGSPKGLQSSNLSYKLNDYTLSFLPMLFPEPYGISMHMNWNQGMEINMYLFSDFFSCYKCQQYGLILTITNENQPNCSAKILVARTPKMAYNTIENDTLLEHSLLLADHYIQYESDKECTGNIPCLKVLICSEEEPCDDESWYDITSEFYTNIAAANSLRPYWVMFFTQ